MGVIILDILEWHDEVRALRMYEFSDSYYIRLWAQAIHMQSYGKVEVLLHELQSI